MGKRAVCGRAETESAGFRAPVGVTARSPGRAVPAVLDEAPQSGRGATGERAAVAAVQPDQVGWKLVLAAQLGQLVGAVQCFRFRSRADPHE